MTSIDRILVPVDFSPSSDAALDYALAIADECGAEVEVLYVWSPRGAGSAGGRAMTSAIFADTPEGVAMEQRLSAADSKHSARVCGRLEFGGEASSVILAILERERFDLVVMGLEGDGSASRRGEQEERAGGHVSKCVAMTAPCKVVTLPPPPLSPDETEAA